MDLTWKSSFAGSEYRIFRGKVIAGILKLSSWKSEGYGELDGNMLRFRAKGFWKPVTEILDIEGQRVLGEIKFNAWKGGATITYENESYHWKYDSWMHSKWSVSLENAEPAKFAQTSFWKSEGELTAGDIPAAVLLTAFYTQTYFARMVTAAV